MKSHLPQPRFPAPRAGSLLAALALVALSSATLGAQGTVPAPVLDPACQCVVGGADSTVLGDRDRDGGWAFLGAAGLALLAGIPLGGAGAPAIPFVEGPAAPAAGVPAGEIAALPPGTETTPAVPGGIASIDSTAGSPPAATDSVADRPMAAPVGLLAPKTATHLPLLAAVGVLLLAGGALLARREARRQRRRRRRLVAI